MKQVPKRRRGKSKRTLSLVTKSPGVSSCSGIEKSHETRSVPAKTEPEPRTFANKDLRDALHGRIVAGEVYRRLAADVFRHHTVDETAFAYLHDLVQELKPRDQLEAMFIQQFVWTHLRLARLAQLSAKQDNLQGIEILTEACNRTANTSRRLLLALDEYRRPATTPHVSIQQASVANQQVVQQTVEPSTNSQKTTKELGLIPMATQGRRSYSLTPEGLLSLRRAIRHNKPWIRSTGPRNPSGKARARSNALKHSERSSAVVSARRFVRRLLRGANINKHKAESR